EQWRDGIGRPGASVLGYTSQFTLDKPAFDQLLRIRDALGLADRERSSLDRRFRDQSRGMAFMPEDEANFYMRDLQDQWQFPAPDGYRFSLGTDIRRSHVPHQSDMDDVLERIDDAARMADWVVVSMHNHEHGANPDMPSD